MPKITANQEAPNPDFDLTQRLLTEFRQTWIDEFQKEGGSSVRFSRLSVVAMTQIAAIVAVDVGMTAEQFVAVSAANFKEAHKQAPKFS